jgi:hypothetical protein
MKPENSTIYKHGIGGKSPSKNLLKSGDLAFNYADGKLYYKNKDGEIVSIFDSILNHPDFSPKDITERITSISVDDAGHLVIETNYGKSHRSDRRIVGPQGRPGAIINRRGGVVGVAHIKAGGSWVDVECEGCEKGSIVLLTLASLDEKTTAVSVVVKDGSFRIYPNEKPAKKIAINYYLPNV